MKHLPNRITFIFGNSLLYTCTGTSLKYDYDYDYEIDLFGHIIKKHNKGHKQ